MPTKGNLEPAIIENCRTQEKVFCMFNPHEYTVAKQNQWSLGPAKGKDVPKFTFSWGGGPTLRLQLFFDTCAEQKDVRECTAGLWKMMLVDQRKKRPKSQKAEPPRVRFIMGGFNFKAVITSLSQQFTLFNKEGIPLRTTVDVTFQQVDDEFTYPGQNPTSGSGAAMRTHIVQAEERLDWIAAEAYGDPSQWRLIAQANRLTHPLRLRPGQQLIIPPLE